MSLVKLMMSSNPLTPSGDTPPNQLLNRPVLPLASTFQRYTVAASALRSTEEKVKTALDKANNNLNFVQASACQVNYSVNDTCAP